MLHVWKFEVALDDASGNTAKVISRDTIPKMVRETIDLGIPCLPNEPFDQKLKVLWFGSDD